MVPVCYRNPVGWAIEELTGFRNLPHLSILRVDGIDLNRNGRFNLAVVYFAHREDAVEFVQVCRQVNMEMVEESLPT